jgi:ApaG protein
MSTCVTQGIKITVRSSYVPEQSDPENGSYIFSYEITILNESERPAQLLTRRWLITDAFNRIEEVKGDGVVGHTPYLESGDSFVYQSFCPLRTPYGFMRGSYGMVRPEGEEFEAIIAPFALMLPSMLN